MLGTTMARALRTPSTSALGIPAYSASWYVGDEVQPKVGAGLLFFAYGEAIAVSHFLEEVVRAARSFQRNSPAINMAVVSNNRTVPEDLFHYHIRPREDLIFQGEACPYGEQHCQKHVARRQWLTRLFYLAHTPFELTWALDSNVVNCVPGGVEAFLSKAMKARLWGYDIAHANQAKGSMYPHNWSILFLWNTRVASLLRDWLLLQLRRGVAKDDQATLFAAEQRQRAR